MIIIHLHIQIQIYIYLYIYIYIMYNVKREVEMKEYVFWSNHDLAARPY